MKPSLQDEIDEAEKAVIRRDLQMMDRLAATSRLATRAIDRSRWMIGGTAATIVGLILVGLLRGRHRNRHVEPSREPSTRQPKSLWSIVPIVLTLLPPGREAAAQAPAWLRGGRLAASIFNWWQTNRMTRR